MVKRSRKYIKMVEKINFSKRYNFSEAMDTILEVSSANFDETVDIAVKLGVDPRHADQMVRGSVVLPNGLGKNVIVLVFAKGEKEIEAKEAGADFVGAENLVEKIKNGWYNFDKSVATPDMMGIVGKIGRILGPRGLMPNAKVGTVTFDLQKAIKELKSGKVDFKVEKSGILHSAMGKVSFGSIKLLENIKSFLEAVIKLKPVSSKGIYLKSISVSTTFGPGVKIDNNVVSEFMR